MVEICSFCKNEFTNKYTLNLHQKSAAFCLKIQKALVDKDQNDIEIKEEKYECEYCNKSFNLKQVLKTHYLNCKVKKEQQIKDEFNNLEKKYREEINQLKNDFKKEINDINNKFEYENEKQREKYEKEFEFKNEQQKLNYEKEIKFKNEQIEKLEKELNDYKNRLFSREEKLTEEMISRPTVYQDNRKQTSYNLQFDKLFEELRPRTEEYIKESIKKIKIDDMIYMNDNAIDYNFACNLVNILKDTVFFTDPSRGKLVYKTENGTSSKMQAEAYILECIKISKPECIEMCKKSLDIVKIRQQDFTEEDYAKCMVGIGQLSDCINKGKQHTIITEISNTLVKASKALSK